MSVLNIRPVRRQAAKIVLGLGGETGEGKTYSALQLAYGLANYDHTKVGFLDTESGRGSWYENIFGSDSRFQYAELEAPHSPMRYMEALREIASSGIEALVIDSMSHEHEGEGGLEDIAHAPKANGQPRKIADWLTAKREHKRMMRVLLSLPVHVVCCFRAREKTDFKDPANPKPLGLQFITERNVPYELTASFMMYDRGRVHHPLKLPGFLEPILGRDGYFTPEQGHELREWLGGGDPMERAKNVLRLAATEGVESLKNAWLQTDKKFTASLASFKDSLKDQALQADKDREAREGAKGEPDGDDSAPDGEEAP